MAGSIAHCERYWAAAVGWRSEITAIGIDVGPRKPLPPNGLRLYATPAEAGWLAGSGRTVPWDLLLFCAKESVYKAWFPVVGVWLGFEEADVEFDPPTESFRAAIRPKGPTLERAPREIVGRYLVSDMHVWTCAYINASPRI